MVTLFSRGLRPWKRSTHSRKPLVARRNAFLAEPVPCDRVPELRTRWLRVLSQRSVDLAHGLSGHMLARRYTVIIADRSSGVMRRVTISVRGVLGVLSAIVGVPILMGLGAKWSARTEIGELRGANTALQVENGSYRAATGELTTQIQSLEDVINDLGARSRLDPAQVKAMQQLPAIVKSRAAGGSKLAPAISELANTPMATPEDTFGVLRSLLQGLENRLTYVRRDVEQREALAAATPSIWPAHGWLTGTFGQRSDPFTGEPGVHQGLDISTEKGQPVYATADGTIESAGYNGDYGNMIIVQHGFGLTTRY